MNLTVRNIPDDVMDKIRVLSTMEKRSVNNQILVLLERGLNENLREAIDTPHYITKDTQLHIWKKLSGKWLDN